MIAIRNLMPYRLEHCDAPLATMPSASAEDKLIVAERTRWRMGASAAAELGQQAGKQPFKKHGLALEFMFTLEHVETEQRVISGSADIGFSAVSVMVYVCSYSFGAHVRIISAHMTS